jgi:hypothetical protein
MTGRSALRFRQTPAQLTHFNSEAVSVPAFARSKEWQEVRGDPGPLQRYGCCPVQRIPLGATCGSTQFLPAFALGVCTSLGENCFGEATK